MKLLAGGEILGKGVYPVKATVMEGNLPINTNACGKYAQKPVTQILGDMLLVCMIQIVFRH